MAIGINSSRSSSSGSICWSNSFPLLLTLFLNCMHRKWPGNTSAPCTPFFYQLHMPVFPVINYQLNAPFIINSLRMTPHSLSISGHRVDRRSKTHPTRVSEVFLLDGSNGFNIQRFRRAECHKRRTWQSHSGEQIHRGMLNPTTARAWNQPIHRWQH